MKKILTFVIAAIAAMTVSAARTTVWTGDQRISWSPSDYEGTQYEVEASNFSSLIKGDTLYVTVTTPESYEYIQYVMTFKAGPGWKWTDLPATVDEGVMTYIIEADSIGKQIAERGLIFRGKGYHITKVVVAAVEDDPDWAETTVWTTETPNAISWDNDSWPGTYVDADIPTLAVNNQIRVYITSSEEGAQYALQYKDGEDGNKWTSLDLGIRDNIIRTTIASDEIATLIKTRGLIVTGIKYYINKVTVYAPKGGTTAIENTSIQKAGVKIMRDGVMYIRRGETLYNMQGQVVK